MKVITSKLLVGLGTIVFATVVVLKFLTIQNFNTGEENFYLYHMPGNKLFTVNNDGNNTQVEIHDDTLVTLRGSYEKNGLVYKVKPFSFIDIGEGNHTATYRFLGDRRKKSFSYPVRFRRYEIIGGSSFGSVVSLARLHNHDRPLLAIFPQKGKKVFGKTNEGIRVVAFQEGLVYVDKTGGRHVLPFFSGTRSEFEKALKNKIIEPYPITRDGVVTSDANSSIVLNFAIDDGTVSKKMKDGSHVAVKTKYITISEYSEFQNISKLVLVQADRSWYVTKEQWQQLGMKAPDATYLDMPYEIPISSKVVVKGRDALFGFSKYAMNADFAKRVPRLDRPKAYNTTAKKRNRRYMDFLDIDNMYGLYVSDENASIYYSRDKKRWIRAVKNYKYAPPLYLYDSSVRGQFVAPKSFKNEDGVLYYKVLSPKGSFDIAFNGKVRAVDARGTLLQEKVVTHKDRMHFNTKELIIEAHKKPLPECGRLFTLDTNKTLHYTFRDGYTRDFRVEKEGGGYAYYIQENLDPFKVHTVHVKGYRDFRLSPQLSCKYKSKSTKESTPSLYADENHLQLIPKERSCVIKQTSIEQNNTASVPSQKGTVEIPKELIPIYGDGKHFGLLSHGIEMDDLTIDKDFSMEVAKIFEREIQPLYKDKETQNLLKKYQGEIIEGATVVLKVDHESRDREVLALFSYPYPQDYDIQKELIIDTMNNRMSTIKNRAFDMLAHPGSTFKIVTALALAQEGKLNDFAVLKGKRNIKGTKFSDGVIDFSLKNYTGSKGATETTTFTDFKNAFAHSYNTYFGYAGLILHKKLLKHYSSSLYPIVLNDKERKENFTLRQVAEQVHFNKPIVLSKEHHIYARASRFPSTFVSAKEVADAAIGQYEVYATPLQMAIVASVVYDNKLQVPKILKPDSHTVEDVDFSEAKKKTFTQSVLAVFKSKNNIDKLQEAMQSVVRSGTAKKHFKHFKVDEKIKVYGKTGTAQKGKKGLYDGWFVSFTKGLKEDIIIATVVRNSSNTYPTLINKKIIEKWVERTEPALIKK